MQRELAELEEKYKCRETQSLNDTTIPGDRYLCIRLDGFHLTKRFLKDQLTNQQFEDAMRTAYEQLFFSFRHYLERTSSSSIVCSFIANDEVSVILRKDITNFDRRVMKLCTLFAGVMSSAITGVLKDKNGKSEVIAFDARPLFLASEQELVEYLRSRYYVANRYTYWKPLRLKGVEGICEPEVMKDIYKLQQLANKENLLKSAKKVRLTFRLVFPEKQPRPKLEFLAVNDVTMSDASLTALVGEYLLYQQMAKRE